jgi:Fic family protein
MGGYKDKSPGILRKKQVYIYLRDSERFEEIRYRPPEPKKITKLLDELILWYNSNVDKLNSIELAAILHLRFYKIHPFIDGNKRISRLLLNKALIDNNKEILNISKNKEKYFDSLINCVENNNEKPFIEFLLSEFKEACK